MRTFRNFACVGVLTGLTLVSASMNVAAQDEPVAPVAPAAEPPPAEPAPAPPPPVEATAQVQTAPAPVFAPAPAPAAAESDHDSVVGSFGIGYLGRRSILIASGIDVDDPTDIGVQEVSAPVLGVRYWFNDMIGLDAGLGFLFSGGKVEVSTPAADDEVDLQGYTAFIIHAGVPLSLADSGHFSFQIVPEINVGFASSTLEGEDDAPDTDFDGLHLDVGARAGAEIHFGFIDIPQLSLQGSIGARFAYDKVGIEVGDSSVDRSTHSIGTSVGDNPWNIFTSNVAALYYF
ncbi:MAG TPA: hypothetical protein VI072_09320 [Polyangiaceae bacterium]